MASAAREYRYAHREFSTNGSLARDLDWAVRERELEHAGEVPRHERTQAAPKVYHKEQVLVRERQAIPVLSVLGVTAVAVAAVMLLLSYMPVFPAFLALRRKYPQAERPFRVPGGPGMLRVLAYVPMVLIGLSILFTAVPLSTDRETLATILPITVGSVISVLLGELLIAVRRHHQPRSGG